MATATATLTISRASPADAKSLVPLTTTTHSPFRYPHPQDTTLQQQPTLTGFGQSGQTHASVSQDTARHDSTASDKTVTSTAHQPRPSQPPAVAPTANLGPCSKLTQVPARPKPGRKPLPQEDAQDRRRVQNRMAQRNFRDKRAQKVSELSRDNLALREEFDQKTRILTNQLHDQTQESVRLAAEIERLRTELQAAHRRADEAERRLQMASHSNGVVRSLNFPHATLQNIGTSTSLPPMMANWNGPVAEHARASSGVPSTPAADNSNNNNNSWNELETDMTAAWNSRRTNNPAQNNAVQNNAAQNNATQNSDNDNQWLSTNMDVDRAQDQCGFCTDEANCACIQSQNSQPQPQPPQSQPQVQSQPVIVPGGCDACVRDPQRAAQCIAIADKAKFIPRPTQNTTNNGDQRNDSMAAPAMISCSSAVDRLGRNIPSIGDLFPGTFHAYPSTSNTGYDLAEQEVAQVLQSMRRNTVTEIDP